jgi:choline-glycine betaine transporter
MGMGMEMTIRINSEIPGFVASIVIGFVLFIGTIFLLTSFEDEDIALLEHLSKFSPQKMKLISIVLLRVCHFKRKCAT